MALPPARPFQSRVRNVIAFLAIVWGVAATFIAFEVASLSAVDLALSYPALFGKLMLSRTVTESTSCSPAVADTRPHPSPTLSDADVSAGSWWLGLGFGRDAVFRQYAESPRELLDQLVAARASLAGRLSVSLPDPFTPEQIANANIEFVAFVEQGGAAETARQLAAAYSPRACELFKLGALWGYSEIVRPALPGERAVFGMEIRHHATRAGVPEPLWRPMLQPTAADAKREEIIAATESLTKNVTTYLAGQR
jgi:hypothetical protein